MCVCLKEIEREREHAHSPWCDTYKLSLKIRIQGDSDAHCHIGRLDWLNSNGDGVGGRMVYAYNYTTLAGIGHILKYELELVGKSSCCRLNEWHVCMVDVAVWWGSIISKCPPEALVCLYPLA